ncbi:MAG: putative nucleotidyltransferase substrate binding domain-containing protein [Geminicoccaceae bacterium]
MPKAFDFSNPPFDRLRPAEVLRVKNSVDVVFFRAGTRIFAAGDLPDHFYVIIKGLVEEQDHEQSVAVHESGDAFDSSILTAGSCRHDFVVLEEAICYRLPIEDFIELTANNSAFAQFFLTDISHKLDTLGQRGGASALGGLTARVKEAGAQAPTYVEAGADLHDAARRMDEAHQSALLVRDHDRLGIVTTVDLTRAAVRDRMPLDTKVAAITHWEVLGIEEESFLFEAALMMARRKVRHLLVRRSGEAVGVLDSSSVLSSLANQADPIGALIEAATTVPELAEASERITHMIRQLHGTGTKVAYITELSTELHRAVTEHLFRMLAPPELDKHACLIVMGSEGRGEYLLKTDQDNGLILEDGFDFPDLRDFCAKLTDALIEVGFPACPGEIMVRNPKWSKPLAGYRESVRDWVTKPGEQALMDIAIFYDAAPIVGRGDLVDDAKSFLFDLLGDNQGFLARFARAIDMFEESNGLLAGLFGRGQDRIDIKKAGIFPLMHGIRALALEKQLRETNTAQRIRRLTELGVFVQEQSDQLSDAFAFLTGLRLSARLEKLRLHETPDNFVDVGEISKLERDLLKDSLQIVRKLKETVRHHFHLNRF